MPISGKSLHIYIGYVGIEMNEESSSKILGIQYAVYFNIDFRLAS